MLLLANECCMVACNLTAGRCSNVRWTPVYADADLCRFGFRSEPIAVHKPETLDSNVPGAAKTVKGSARKAKLERFSSRLTFLSNPRTGKKLQLMPPTLVNSHGTTQAVKRRLTAPFTGDRQNLRRPESINKTRGCWQIRPLGEIKAFSDKKN